MHEHDRRHDQHLLPNSTTVQVRASLPKLWSTRLDHLSIELGVSKTRLLLDGVLLVLRHHDVADGLPEPLEPLTRSTGHGVTQ